MDGNNIENELLHEFGGSISNNFVELLKENSLNDQEPSILSTTKYLDLESLEQFARKNRNSFSIFSVNIQSLNAKFSELSILLKYIKDHFNFSFSVISLQETWLDDDADTDYFEIPNYKIFAQGKQVGYKGGLITYIHKEFTGKNRPLYKKSKDKLWEGQCIQITGDRLSKKVCLSNIYRPPRLNNSNDTIQTFLTEISPYIEKLDSEPMQKIILGDFNLNLLEIHTREKIAEYYDKFLACGFLPRITLPTRFSKKSCTLIDQIFCNFENPTENCDTAILTSRLTDHLR